MKLSRESQAFIDGTAECLVPIGDVVVGARVRDDLACKTFEEAIAGERKLEWRRHRYGFHPPRSAHRRSGMSSGDSLDSPVSFNLYTSILCPFAR